MVGSSFACGVFDSLFVSTDFSKGITWGSNETAPYAVTSTSKIIFKERDYDKDPTPLYKAMERQQWSKVCGILKDKSVNIEQANTWTFRKEANSDKIRWRMTALHSAIVLKAPLNCIKSLLRLSPQSASCKDDQGMLPIHLAFRNDASDEIMYELLVVYPLGIDIKDNKGRLPLSCGISQNPDSHRWKVLGTYSAMAKLGRKREAAKSDDTSRKLNKVKKLYEQELGHLNDEYEHKIEECSSQISAYEGQISDHEKTIQDLTDELKQERHKIQILIDELNGERTKIVKLKDELDDERAVAKVAEEERRKISSLHENKKEEVKQLRIKIQEVEDELYDWRNSLFGGSLRSLFFCSS